MRTYTRIIPPNQHRMLEKDEKTMTGVCAICGPVPVIRRKGSLRCRYGKVKPERLRMKQKLKRMLRDGKTCEVCGEVRENMTLDHKHGDKTWRGVLCNKHNTGLGMFDDDPVLLRAAAEYLERYDS